MPRRVWDRSRAIATASESAQFAGLHTSSPGWPACAGHDTLRSGLVFEELGPARHHALLEFGTRFRGFRELVLPVPRLAGIDDGAIVLIGRASEHRIQGCAPMAVNVVDVVRRIAAGAHRP